MSEPTLPPSKRSSGRHLVRVLVPVGAVALALGGVAIAEAATDSGVDTPHDLAERGLDAANPAVDDDTPPPTAATPASDARTEAFELADLPDGTTQTFVAGAAGTVTIARSGSTLRVVAVVAIPPWVTEIEQLSGPEVEVVFRNGTARTDFEAELEDGTVRVRVRERTDAVDDNDPDDDDVAPPTPPATRVDNSGSGSVNSGPGSVDSGRDGDDRPDHEVGDDSGSHSGSGSSGSGSSGSGSSGSGGSDSGHSGPG